MSARLLHSFVADDIIGYECPECGADLQAEFSRELYGEDADGHRGEWRDHVEVVKQDCECELSEDQIQELGR
jgi:hypothetical protein